MIFGFAAVAVASLGIAAFPLTAFVLLTALFGLPHVLYEMRYVDERFSGRLSRVWLGVVGVLILGIAAARGGRALGLFSSQPAMLAELCLGVLLAIAAVSAMRKNRLLGAAFAAVLITGVMTAPILTFLAFAWLHNLTPLAFAAERAEPGQRTRTLLWLSLPFLAVPTLIASGAPQALMAAAFRIDPLDDPSLFGAGAMPLGAFMPAGTYDPTPLFAAAVTAQAMHYFAVIVMLPRLQAAEGAGHDTLVRWPSWPVFGLVVAGLALVSLGLHAADFPAARSAYGVAAAMHSWIELPILLMALGGLGPAMVKDQTRVLR